MTCAEGRLLLTKLDMSRSLPEIRYSIRVHADMAREGFTVVEKNKTNGRVLLQYP